MRGFLFGLVFLAAGLSGAWAQGVKVGEPLTVEVTFWNGLANKEPAGRYVVPGFFLSGVDIPVANPKGERWVLRVTPDTGGNEAGINTMFGVSIKDRDRPIDGGGLTEIFLAFFPLALDSDLRVFEAPDYAVSVRFTRTEVKKEP